MKFKSIGLLALLLVSACSGKNPVAPTPPAPTIPACQANHTASASFKNNTTRVIDVILDGGTLGTLASGETGLARTVAAGVAHDIRFRVTNTNINMCAAFNPIPVECSTPVYGSCTF
jgi:hypothetical protein